MRRQGLPKYCSEFQDRHGKWRVRARRTGLPTLYINHPIGSDDFGTAYRSWLDRSSESQKPRLKNSPITFNELIAEYYSSPVFTGLKPVTKISYRRVRQRFCADHGLRIVIQARPEHLTRILESKADTPVAANMLRKRLNQIFNFGIDRQYLTDNPIKQVKKIRHIVKGYRTWTEEDISKFRSYWVSGSQQRIAFEILLWTGLRRTDAVVLGPKHRNTNVLTIRTSKSNHTTELEIPIHSQLLAQLALAPPALTYISTITGKPRSAKAFTNWIREAAIDAGLPSNSSPHGLRKAACRRLAEAGCTGPMIQSITGHKDLREVDTYIQDANKKQLAIDAMAMLTDEWKEDETGT